MFSIYLSFFLKKGKRSGNHYPFKFSIQVSLLTLLTTIKIVYISLKNDKKELYRKSLFPFLNQKERKKFAKCINKSPHSSGKSPDSMKIFSQKLTSSSLHNPSELNCSPARLNVPLWPVAASAGGSVQPIDNASFQKLSSISNNSCDVKSIDSFPKLLRSLAFSITSDDESVHEDEKPLLSEDAAGLKLVFSDSTTFMGLDSGSVLRLLGSTIDL